jgi:CDP-paratose 2-epimerase|tara:strand:+ start:984 stop:2012 length:1029 start_codon:yes stop_codon:yes gene_type:complete
MKILITGGCGFVGSNICIFLKKKLKKAQIFSLDNFYRKGSRLNASRLKKHGIKNFNVDIRNFKKISNLIKFDLIIDCCAEPAIEASIKDPDRVFETNLIGTFNILKKCTKDKTNIIFLSSSRVYSIQNLRNLVKNLNLAKPIKNNKKIQEDFETALPSSIYGFTKLSSEKLIREFSYMSKVKHIINRFGVIAGPWQFGKQDQGFVSLWIARHLIKKKLSYIGFGGHGNQKRDIIHIFDVCEIIYLQIKNIKKIYNETFNVGGGTKNSISLKLLTKKCEVLTGNKLKIGKQKKTSIYDIPSFVVDNSKIKKFYKWQPKKNINDILNDIYEWLNSNKKIRKYFI